MPDKAQILLNVFDGTRKLVDSSLSLVITIRDGTQKLLLNTERPGPSIAFNVPVSDGKTDPRKIYLLRWIAGQRAGVPEFDPPYTIGAIS